MFESDFDDWGRWRVNLNNSSHLDYRCPLGFKSVNDYDNDLMFAIEDAYSRLKKVNGKAAKAFHMKYAQHLPLSVICERLTEKKTSFYNHAIYQMGELFKGGFNFQ